MGSFDELRRKVKELVERIAREMGEEIPDLDQTVDSLVAAVQIEEDLEHLGLKPSCLLAIIIKLLLHKKFGLVKIKKEVHDIEDKLDDKKTGLKSIKEEIKDIEDKLDQIVTVTGRLTTGPVVLDVTASSLVVKVLNTTNTTQTVTVTVFNIGTCPNPKTVFATTTLTIEAKCAEAFTFPEPPLEYEVKFVGNPNAFQAWTATRTQAQAEPLSASNFIPSNTFRHAELVPEIDP